MKYRVALLAALVSPPLPLAAADLPAIRTSERNAMPECATPGRMMQFLRSRNEDLDARFDKIAVDYMRHGEELGLRWDYAFFQMLIETGYLTFRGDGGRHGLVKPTQNNFAGLGAVGKGQAGESFQDVSTGVLAHLQHVLMYTGENIENPVAERTRKVVQWGVLKSWQKKIKGPMTYAQLAKRWATNSDYAEAIETHADRFYAQFCKKPDPNPDLVREARGIAPDKPRRKAEVAAADKPKPTVTGAELARQAIEEGKLEDNNKRTGLGGAFLARSAADAARAGDASEAVTDTSGPAGGYTVLNPPRADAGGRADRSEKPATLQTVSAGGTLTRPVPPVAAASKCRVWTASYGGQKAILIKAQSDGAVNYTVLDVNDGAEKREADAYIAAYAKNGAIAGEFPNPSQALDKAFELCPEG